MGMNDKLRELMARLATEKRPIGTAAYLSDTDIDALIEALSICRQITGSMPLSTRGMALNIAVYHALATARAYKDNV